MTDRPPFIADQGMRLLMADNPWKYLIPEAFRGRRMERGGLQEDTGGEEGPWQPVDRSAVALDRVSAEDSMRISLHRLVVTTDAGIGKTTNLGWMYQRINQLDSQAVAFAIALGGAVPVAGEGAWLISLGTNIPANGDELISQVFAPRLCRTISRPIANPEGRAMELLIRLRDQGRLVLLFDALDQAGGDGAAVGLLKDLLGHDRWNRCRIVVSGRPHAILRYREELFNNNQIGWR